jgi:hypothetical protein
LDLLRAAFVPIAGSGTINKDGGAYGVVLLADADVSRAIATLKKAGIQAFRS